MGVYLDNAATSYPKPPEVVNGIVNYMNNIGTTSGRGAYRKALEADRLVYKTRKLIAKLFKQEKTSNVIFATNATEAINTIIKGIVKKGDHVITSSLEHNAVWRCLKTVEKEKKITISTVPCTKEGYTDPKDVEKYIRKNTSLIIFNHASNVIGTIQPIRKIGEIAKKYDIPFVVDAAQTAGIYPIDINKDNIDILTFTGHKSLFGPTGTGGFILNWNGNLTPLKEGGTGGDSSYEYQPDYLPNKFEAGTLNICGIAGLKEGLEYILNTGINNIFEKEKKLIAYTLNRLMEIDKLTIYGPKDPEKIVGVVSFNIEGLSAEEVAYRLDSDYGIMVRSGLHCAPTAHSIIGTKNTGTVRISIGYFNTKKDIDLLVNALKEIIKLN
ncbi:aminotransferase class V-fold PLP-dependent enzyme [Thermohalobacter berrensis]|uniref:cysteine desulfurase n=1 Tax=Thermohalobacter berrensis TaxID=99594 RepID=A0A419T890_9FIRM|nr:aminotransferase class V-fold PLP-dependent enzyme [Thermohalobacter berrensis]RKD33770.1 cysteine desulfurase [Thermohalobacter berrensis]